MRLPTDLRYLRRSAVRSPGPAVAVWACTAIWIAVAPAFLALLGALQWKSLPFPESGRMVEINAGLDLVPALAASGRFQAVAGYSAGWVVAEGARGVFTVAGAAVDDGFFAALGSRALTGRVFMPATRSADVDGTVITAGLCRRLFGSAEPPEGGAVRLAGRRFPVLGVVADQPVFPPPAELWVLSSSRLRLDSSFLPAKVPRVGIVGRLAPEVSPQAASATARAVARSVEKRDHVLQGEVEVVALEELLRRNSRGERGILAVSLAGLLGFVLLAYASALSGFLAERQGELAVRIALGARRFDLVRLMLLEVVVLAVPGLLTGLPFAALALRRLADFVPFSLAALIPPRLDAGSLALALAGWAGVASASAMGVWLSAPQIGASAVLGPERSEGRRTGPRARLRLGFVCAALSLAVALGAVTAVLRQSLWNLQREPLGFEPENAVSAVVRFDHPPQLEELAAHLDRLTERIAGVPGVRAVALSSALPFGDPGRYQDVSSADRSEFWQVRRQGVFGDYRQAAGLRLIAGRDLSRFEQETGAPVALLDGGGAREIFGGRSPLGQTLLLRDRPVEIVGVVASAKGASLDEPARPQLYVPMLFALEAKAVPDALAVTARLSGGVREADFNAAVAGTGAVASQYQPLAERVEAASSVQRLAGDLASLQWLAALALVSLATFGTFSWLLELRSHELALRLALGDTRGGIARRILRSALGVVAMAALLGLAIYLPSGQALRALLFGVDVLSPAALFTAIGAVASVALLAAGLATRSALRRLSLDLLRNYRLP